MTSARTVFERDGLTKARVADIVRGAGVAHGTFYLYFRSKEDVFHEVAKTVLTDTLDTGFSGRTAGTTPYALIEATNRAYLTAYARNSKILALIEQADTLSEEILTIRRERYQTFVKRTEEGIVNLQERGLADKEIDVHHMAMALSGMVSRMAYFAYIQKETVDLEAMVHTLSGVWARALGLDCGYQTKRKLRKSS